MSAFSAEAHDAAAEAQFKLRLGDCIEEMRGMADNSVDAIVTDPPYELGFMGKSWDASGIAYNVDMWREALRVLKPGGHLLAFSGSRTYHRMTVAIEDASFEIRDQIMWVYSSGFPKSHNLDNHRGKLTCACTHEKTESKAEHNLRAVRGADVSPTVDAGGWQGEVLQPGLPEQGASTAGRPEFSGTEDGGGQSSLEGRRDDVQAQGELQGYSVHSCAGRTASDGAGGWLHDGAPRGDGGMVRVPADADGSGSSRRPRSDEQSTQQPGALADKQRAQEARAWPDCAGCGLPVVPQGLGTALKPAHEPICVARKPLIGTVAGNLLQFGTGALNIDGCRVAHVTVDGGNLALNPHLRTHINGGNGGQIIAHESNRRVVTPDAAGRWPANLIHDGSDEVVALFPQSTSGAMKSSTQRAAQDEPGSVCFGTYGGAVASRDIAASSGSAARFFYCAKASRADRNDGLDDPGPQFQHGSTLRDAENLGGERKGNHHPTVKPTDLMAYLCRLVTPPGGLVLDPFMGSGSTGKAAMREGFKFLGIELDEGYLAIARARIEHEVRAVARRGEEAAATAVEARQQRTIFELDGI